MSRRILIVLFWVLVIGILLRPKSSWKELSRIWSQRDWMVKVLAIVIGIYFIYGLYMYWIDWIAQ